MARKGAKEERVSLAQAARWLGMTEQGVGQYASQPGAPVQMEAGRRWLLWPAWVVWYRDRLAKGARTDDAAVKAAKERRIVAETELVELELAKERGEVVRIEDFDRVVGATLDLLRVRILALPGRLAPLVVGVEDLSDATSRIKPVVAEILTEIARARPVVKGRRKARVA